MCGHYIQLPMEIECLVWPSAQFDMVAFMANGLRDVGEGCVCRVSLHGRIKKCTGQSDFFTGIHLTCFH